MTEKNDISNQKLFGFITREMVALFVLGGVAWGVMARDVETNKEVVIQVKKEQRVIKTELSDIKVDVGKNSTKLDAQADDIADLKDGQKRILDILERRFR